MTPLRAPIFWVDITLYGGDNQRSMTDLLIKDGVGPFSEYASYVSGLECLARESSKTPDWIARVYDSLNGQASVELRKVAPVEIRRQHGVFFTGGELAERLLGKSKFNPDVDFIYDPAVGAGDLLLAAARRMPLKQTLKSTLESWGRCLAGTDLHDEFIQVAKLRITLLARQRHGVIEGILMGKEEYFPYIRKGDGLFQKSLYSKATHIIMNPPFSMSGPMKDCEWAGGRVSDAALFVVKALEACRPKTQVLAILPEVLRSGSFQSRWRGQVGELSKVHSVKYYGQFDKSTDIDVFLLTLERRGDEPDKRKRWPQLRISEKKTVAKYFDVSVGSVVPHRDRKTGPRYEYIHARCVPAWGVMNASPETRRFNGTVYKPPFVVIRRTSRPGPAHRATATVIVGSKQIAVENHLIVLKPKDGKLVTCKQLLKRLMMEATDQWLNRRICCRHLTVGAVTEIPFKMPFPRGAK